MATAGFFKKDISKWRLWRHNFCLWRHQKILSHDWNYIVYVVIWPKFRNSSISFREVKITSNLWGFDQKNTFFLKGCSWFKFNNLGLALRMTLKFYISLAKGLKLKIRKFCGQIPTFVEATGEELVEGGLFAPQSWIGLTQF